MSESEPISPAPEAAALPPATETAEADPGTWVERLKSIDYSDHKGAIVTAGAAALALGVGVYSLSKRHGGREVKIDYGDRRMQEKGIISLVERTQRGGVAAGLATTKAALEALGKTKEVFGMEDGHTTYPLERDEDTEQATGTLRKVTAWLIDIYASRGNEPDETRQK